MNWKTRLTLRLALSAGLGTLALVRAAYGGSEPAAPAAAAPALTPPKLVHFEEAAFPEEAKAAGRATVVELELTIDPTGAVTEARPTAAVDDPIDVAFDDAAVAAAKRFVFEPARRGDTAIPARIRYRYVFEMKAPPPPPPPTTGALEGRVLLRQGDGVVLGANVDLVSDDGSLTRSTRTASDGSFTFGDLPKGRYHVRVAGQDLAPLDGAEDVTAGDLTSVTYRLEAAGRAPAAGEELEFGATATIEAPPREVTKRTLKAEELLRVAGTRGDALQAIEYMPGVGRGQMGFVIIRGSSPADSEVEFEGAPVYRLYHFGGLTSFVHSRMLERIDLYPGNFSARFGRKMGGIIDVGVRDPKSDGFHGVVDVNVVDTSLLVEGPISRHLSLAIAAKRSYIDFFIDKLLPAEIGVTAAPVYWDYQLMLSYTPTERDRVRAMVYGSYDDFQLTLKNPAEGDPSVRGNIGQNSSFHRAQVSWRHKYSDAVEHEISTTVGPFKFAQNVGPELRFDVPGYDVYTRAEWRAQVHERVRLIGGLDLRYAFFQVQYHGPAIEQFDGNPDLFGPLAEKKNVSIDRNYDFASPAAFVEMVLQPTDRLQLVPGARIDRFGNVGRYSVDPRITSRFEVLSGTTLKGGVGLFTQEPDLAEAAPVIGNPNLRMPRAQHYGLGVDQQVGQRLLLTLDGFYKRLDRLTVASAVPGEILNNDGIGRIYGLEASARLNPDRHTTGFVSYTLSRSRRNDHGDGWRAFNWDQTHILTVAGALRLGHGWDLSSTFRYVTGNPMTPVVDSTYNANNDLYRPVYGRVNSDRNPAFHRLDLRIEKTWQGKSASIATYLDVQNAYNRRNQEGRTYNYNFAQSKEVPGLPVIPSIGIRGEI